MGLMDAFVADAKVEFKVGDLYDILRVAASNEKTAQFLKNAIECEVPYNYIREVITGKKEEKKEFDGIRVEIPSSILNEIAEEAKKAEREAAARVELAEQGKQNPDEVLKDCAPENVPCEECPHKDFCENCAEDIAGLCASLVAPDEPNEESEGGER